MFCVKAEKGLPSPRNVWKKRATKTIFRIKHSSTFNAEIKPSVGLAEEERQHQERLAREEASKKVWNPKLTSEEQKVIEERRKSQNLEGEAPKELFKVVSARLPEANRFIEQEDRQQLLRTRDRKGRVAAQEVMLVNFGIAGLIREAKSAMIPSFIHMGAEEGMQSMDSHLIELCMSGWIDTKTAFDHCIDRGVLSRAGLVDPEEDAAASTQVTTDV